MKKARVSKVIKQSWQITRDGRPYFIEINPREVVIGEGSPPNDVGTAVSYLKFLAGEWHDHIRANFSEAVLREVIDAVHHMPETEQYQAFHKKEQEILQFLHSIPMDDALAVFETQDNIEEFGYTNYGNCPNFQSLTGTKIARATRLYSDKMTLVYGTTDTLGGELLPCDQAVGYLSGRVGQEKLVDVGIQPEEGIAWKHWFYIVSGQTFVVIDDDAQMLSQNEEMKMFGSDLRVQRVFRKGDTVVFQYHWFYGTHPDGVLTFNPHRKRIATHWQFKREMS